VNTPLDQREEHQAVLLLDLLRAAEHSGVPTFLLQLADELVVGLGIRTQNTVSIRELAELQRSADTATKDTESRSVRFVTVPFDPLELTTVVEPVIVLRAPELYGPIQYGQVSIPAEGRAAVELWTTLSACASQLESEPTELGPLLGDAVQDDNLRKAWSELFHGAKELLNENFLQKIVLSQEISAPITPDFTIVRALQRLQRSHPNAHLYFFANQLGASPELIVSKRGRSIRSTPLAGTRRKDELGELLDSSKDRAEHGFVVEHIIEKLLELNCNVDLMDPDLIDLGDLVHIRSRIDATAPDMNHTIFDLIAAIAPTPAIAGTPTRRAIEAIRSLEGSVRGAYGGLLGVVEPNGDGEFYLSIRGLERRDSHVFLRSGVGIVADSNEDAEFEEIQAKLATTYRPLRTSQ
jgi:isochorismate synthase EntC